MSVSMLDNISYLGKKADNVRSLFNTIDEMVAFNENYLPDIYECNVVEDGNRYRYNRSNIVDENLGKWRLVESGGSASLIDYYKKTETDSKIAEAVSGKVNTSDFNTYSGNVDTAIGSKAAQSDLNTLSGTVTRHTADTSIHVTSTEKENLDSLATNIAAISGVISTKINNWDNAVTNLGGFKLVEITQSDYDNLPTPRDSKTLYIIRN